MKLMFNPLKPGCESPTHAKKMFGCGVDQGKTRETLLIHVGETNPWFRLGTEQNDALILLSAQLSCAAQPTSLINGQVTGILL